MKLELVAVPVTDVDRAKEFYVKVGFNADHDHTVSDEVRFVQMTPPGSACSIAFGKGLTADGARVARQPADGGRRRRRDPRRARWSAASRSARSTSSRGAGSSTSATRTATAGRSRSSRTGRPARAGPARTRMPEPRTYPEGVTSWVDVEVRDVDAAQAFYGGLFGWTFEQVSPRRTSSPSWTARTSRGSVAATDPARLEHLRRGRRRRRGGGSGPRARRPGHSAARTRPATRAAPSPAPTRPACRSGSGRPARGPARRWSTPPAPGTSATCTPPIPTPPPSSTRRCSAWASTTSGSRR